MHVIYIVGSSNGHVLLNWYFVHLINCRIEIISGYRPRHNREKCSAVISINMCHCVGTPPTGRVGPPLPVRRTEPLTKGSPALPHPPLYKRWTHDSLNTQAPGSGDLTTTS